MFQKKQIIYSETLGACKVENIVQLAASKDAVPVEYYVLKPLFDKRTSAYIPTQNHSQVLREMFTLEEAMQIRDAGIPEENTALKKAVEYVLKSQQNQER